MNNSLPFKVRYADGGKVCGRCDKTICAGRLELAIMMQSDDDDCQITKWYHMKCFFRICLPRTEAAIAGFVKLRYADQLALKVHLGTMDIESDNETKTPTLPDFAIEYAKGDQDSCVGCQQKIKMKEIRVMNVVYDASRNTAFDGRAMWYHVICFAQSRSELGWLQSAELFPGFKRLSEEDRDIVKNQIPLIRREFNEPTENRSNPNQEDLEKLIEVQNKEYYELYDNLAKYVSVADRCNILGANLQPMFLDPTDLLHHLTDVLYFGALDPCDKCKTGELQFGNSGYVCTKVSNWSVCGNVVKEPKRRSIHLTEDLLAKYPFLPSHRPIRVRALHSFRLTDDNGLDLVYAPYNHPKLFNMEFVVIGKLNKTHQEIEKTIRKMGGKVVSVIHKELAAVISNPEEVQRMGVQIKMAKRHNIPVVPEDFLAEVSKGTDPIFYIISESLCDWGGDPYERIKQNDVLIRREPEFYTKSVPEKVTYKWKDGCAVDPECGLEENAHVYSQRLKGRLVNFSVTLGLVDIENDKNTYHRMQLLESNNGNVYWLFESWGRISTSIGSKRLETYGKKDLASVVDRFKLLYKEKTGNNFGNVRFLKHPGQFYHLDIEFAPNNKTLNTKYPTTLTPSVYQLMQMLFDLSKMESQMKSQMVSCDLDLKQMPLGKVSAKQIKSAMTVLQKIAKLISRNGTYADLRDASNKFYTFIPHGFGVNRPPIIDSIRTVQDKTEMLESLLNMELIYEFLDGQNGKSNPLDACYVKLKNDIVEIDKFSNEFYDICNVVRDTHGATHNLYTLEVIEVFKIKREGEDDRFQAYANLPNHQLLWHGSRLMNFVSILSNGLKIAPPEAPVNGYMFGKGIYFADVASKAANYCLATKRDNIRLMLLCEVALGHMQDLYFTNPNIVGLPNDQFQSVRGCGRNFPLQFLLMDGTYIWSGNLTQAQYQTGLHYNEYIVYDPAQVKIKYLVKVKFNFP